MSIQVENDFLAASDFKWLQDYCQDHEFKTLVVGDKSFLVLPTPHFILPFLQKKKHNIILSFIRKAHAEFDTQWNIHADNLINGVRATTAAVLYISLPKMGYTGTAFWKHKKYGKALAKNCTSEEFDTVLQDANVYDKWIFRELVLAKNNRMVSYDASNFHSKYPNKIKNGERIVLVVFYTKNVEKT